MGKKWQAKWRVLLDWERCIAVESDEVIFEQQDEERQIKRLSIDCKATVQISEYARGGETRGDHRAADYDMGCKAKHVPFSKLMDEDNGGIHQRFGRSFKTRDFIVDSLTDWWKEIPVAKRAAHPHPTQAR